jgi:hypothetical protein
LRLLTDSSATCLANAARSRMISSTVNVPTIERSDPASTSWVNASISGCWWRKRWAAARTAGSEPPTFTMATASRLSRMPCLETAPRICTRIDRLASDSGYACSTKGLTKTPPPITTFWPDRSIDDSPVSGFSTGLPPLRPTTMSASDGFAIL